MTGLLNIVGGAMSGFGEALQDEGKQERAAALKILEQNAEQINREHGYAVQHGYAVDEENVRAGNQQDNTRLTYDLQGKNQAENDARDHTNRLSEESARGAEARKTAGYTHGLDDNDVTREVTLEDGSIVGITKTGKTVQLKDNTGRPLKSNTDGLTASESRAYKVYQQEHTDTDATSGEKTVDYKSMYDQMRQENPSLYRKIKGSGAGGGGGDGSIPVPAKFANEPDGTILAKDGKQYKKQGGKLIPQ